MIERLKQLVQEWEVNEQYLGGPNESAPDRYAAMSYGDCAKKLRAVIENGLFCKCPNGTGFTQYGEGVPVCVKCDLPLQGWERESDAKN